MKSRIVRGINMALLVSLLMVGTAGPAAALPPCGGCYPGSWCPCNYTCYTGTNGGCMECTVCGS